MQLTRAALPSMLVAGTGTVINVASIAGLVSGGDSTYSASKAWIVSFTEGLAGSLKGTGVGVHAVCPGWVRTEFHQRAGTDPPSIPEFAWLSVEDVIRQGLADIARGKVISVPGITYKTLVTIGLMMPRRLSRRLASRAGAGRGCT